MRSLFLFCSITFRPFRTTLSACLIPEQVNQVKLVLAELNSIAVHENPMAEQFRPGDFGGGNRFNRVTKIGAALDGYLALWLPPRSGRHADTTIGASNPRGWSFNIARFFVRSVRRRLRERRSLPAVRKAARVFSIPRPSFAAPVHVVFQLR